MSIVIDILRGWYLPWCNFKMPLLIRFACIQIVATRLDAVRMMESCETLKRICESDLRIIEYQEKTITHLHNELQKVSDERG